LKVLVTGADGLLGSNLVRALLANGYTVTALIYPGSNASSLDGLDVERLDGDLLDDAFSLAEAFKGHEGVFHCAAVTDLWAPPDLTWKVNLEGTRRVLDACVEAAVRRLVFVGSASSFEPGRLERGGDETGGFPTAYRDVPYMESKHRAAELVREYVGERGLDAVIVAPTFLLGPYDTRPSGGELVRRFLEGGMKVTSSGGRNLAYAPDVACATLAAFERGRKGETYILGGENLEYRDFFNRLAQITGGEPPRYVMPKPLILAAGTAGSWLGKITGKAMGFNSTIARLAVLGTYYFPEKARQELDLQQTPVETAIRDSVRALREYGHLRLPGGDYFKDKVALVTGASRGVGFATARALVLRGAKVVITARGEERLLKSKAELEALGGDVVAVSGDVGQWEDAERMVAAAIERFGRLDIVVNNAGVSMRGHFADLTPEVCRQVTETNLMGCIHVSKAAMEHVLAAKGQLVFVSSIAGLFGLPGASIYCAAKKALSGLAESLRLELLPRGVHVGVVYLGFTEHDRDKRVLVADGSLTPPERPAHHTQAYAARLIVDMLRQRKRHLIMTPAGSLGWLAYRLSPALLEWLILRAQAGQWRIFKRFS